MKFFRDFLRQKVPKPGAETPAYYRNALTVSEHLLTVYFALSLLLFWHIGMHRIALPAVLLAAVVLAFMGIRRLNPRWNLFLYAAITLAWSGWYVYTFGWGSGSQHLLIPVLVFIFFDIYEPPWLKLVMFAALIACRMALFSWSLSHPALFELTHDQSILFQTVNSLNVFVIMALVCILFSSNTQATERKLRLDNQLLHREAGTDPLTQLPNRRALLDEINLFLQASPQAPFSVAIADIDFFKHVNDTYGHACGDYTLKSLADRFRELAGTDYRVCRWGGEEFCFFLPGKNLDEAAAAMTDVCIAVRRMPLHFEDNEFRITITIGVAENDFLSPMQAIVEEADRKLYIGKNSGRNQVVV